jgi:hypothetical protein
MSLYAPEEALTTETFYKVDVLVNVVSLLEIIAKLLGGAIKLLY